METVFYTILYNQINRLVIYHEELGIIWFLNSKYSALLIVDVQHDLTLEVL